MRFLKKIGLFIKRVLRLELNNFLRTTIFLFFPLVFGIVTNIFVSMEIPGTRVTISSDWIGFYGNIYGAALGVIITIMIFDIKDDREKEKKVRKMQIYHYNYFDIYLTKLTVKCSLLKGIIEKRIKEKHFNPKLSDYMDIEINDFTSELSYLFIEGMISNEIINSNMFLEIEVENLNKVKKELEIHYSTYFDFNHSDYSPEELDKLMAKSYESLLSIIENINSNIEEIKNLNENNINNLKERYIK